MTISLKLFQCENSLTKCKLKPLNYFIIKQPVADVKVISYCFGCTLMFNNDEYNFLVILNWFPIF